MKLAQPEIQSWNVYVDGVKMYVVTYLKRCTESHVLACVRHEFGNKNITIKLGAN